MADDSLNSDISKEQINKSSSEHYINSPKYSDDDLIQFKDAWLAKHEHIIRQEPFSGQSSLQYWQDILKKDKNFFSNFFGFPIARSSNQNEQPGQPFLPQPPVPQPYPPVPQPPPIPTPPQPQPQPRPRPIQPINDDQVVPQNTTQEALRSYDGNIRTMKSKKIASLKPLYNKFLFFDPKKSKIDNSENLTENSESLKDIEEQGSYYNLPARDTTGAANATIANATTATDANQDKRVQLSTDDLIQLQNSSAVPVGAKQSTEDPNLKLAQNTGNNFVDISYELHEAQDDAREHTNLISSLVDKVQLGTLAVFDNLRSVENSLQETLAENIISAGQDVIAKFKHVIDLSNRNYFDEANNLFSQLNYTYNYMFDNAYDAVIFFQNLVDNYKEGPQLMKTKNSYLNQSDFLQCMEIQLNQDDLVDLIKPDSMGEAVALDAINRNKALKDYDQAVPNDKNFNLNINKITDSAEDVLRDNKINVEDPFEEWDLSAELEKKLYLKEFKAINSYANLIQNEYDQVKNGDLSEMNLANIMGHMIENIIRLDHLKFVSSKEFSPDQETKLANDINSVMPIIDRYLKEVPENLYVLGMKNLLVKYAQDVANIDLSIYTNTNEVSTPMAERIKNIMSDLLEIKSKANVDDEEFSETPEKTKADELLGSVYKSDIERIVNNLEMLSNSKTGTSIAHNKYMLQTLDDIEALLEKNKNNPGIFKNLLNTLVVALFDLWRRYVTSQGPEQPAYPQKKAFGFLKNKKIQATYEPINFVNILDHYISGLKDPQYFNDILVKKQAAGCGYCGCNDNLCSHNKDINDITCDKCLKANGMSSKRYSTVTNKFYNIDNSAHKFHKQLNKQHKINKYLESIDSLKPNSKWEEFDESAKIKKNFVKPYTKSYMMDRPHHKNDINKLTYFMGMLEHNKENMTPEAKANLFTLINNHLSKSNAFLENQMDVKKANGLRININAFDTFDALKTHLLDNPYFLNHILL